jgi:hypothetical protein
MAVKAKLEAEELDVLIKFFELLIEIDRSSEGKV